MKLYKAIFTLVVCTSSMSLFAAPMPHTITVEDRAIVPVLKTEIIRKIPGQEVTRHVEATILEISNKGKDVVAKELVFNDEQQQFSEKKLSAPLVKRGGVIVPTSKIELNTTIKQGDEVLSQTKKIDAEGVEFRRNQIDPIKRTLKLNEAIGINTNKKVSHVVITEAGEKTKDLLIINDDAP